ncbi:MAG: hypothetical protein DELT_01326 [Desulfovibrio sp.]
MVEETFAEKMIRFNEGLHFSGWLPEGVRIMNPFRENDSALAASSAFYRKFYNDSKPRRMLVGINPGRFGAGLTGVPFTDPKRLVERCGLTEYSGPAAHEPSSVFVYKVIQEYGGEEAFYRDWYINSICPLGFTLRGKNGGEKNYNYYDSPELFHAVKDFMVSSMRAQLALGLTRDVAFCLGTGKNFAFVGKLNKEYGFFEKILPLEHPRYIIQYKTKMMDAYVAKYLDALLPYATRFSR